MMKDRDAGHAVLGALSPPFLGSTSSAMTLRLRKTRQKDAIRAAFEQAARPLSPDEALSAAQTIVQGISVATVYRNINSLVAERWLSIVEVPGEPSRYEVAGKGHHHHFHCRHCGRIYDLPGCALPTVTPTVPQGFELTGHELFLYGLCAPCTAPAA